MPKSPNDPAECSAEKEDMITSIFDQVIGMGSKCVGCSGLWVWAEKGQPARLFILSLFPKGIHLEFKHKYSAPWCGLHCTSHSDCLLESSRLQ